MRGSTIYVFLLPVRVERAAFCGQERVTADGAKIGVSMVLLLSAVNPILADDAEGKGDNFLRSLRERQTLTNGFFGLGDSLADRGIDVGLGATRMYQQNVRGGISTHRQAGRHSGSYDLEVSGDLQRLLGIEGARLYTHTEGRWSKSGSIDAPSVGSAFGVNADGGPRRSMDVTELWYEQSMFGGSVLLRVGKMDLTGGFQGRGYPLAFDTCSFAYDQTTQFMNGALVNNPTIPFPDYAVGVAGLYNPVEWWYASAAVVDAQNDARETGLQTTFHDEDYFFYVFETGVTAQLDSDNGPLPGAYRAGLWNDPQPKANSDAARNYRDDVGFYLSCDQVLAKENADPNDSQGLGVFFRYGYANGRRNDITDFWSFGFQYQGLIEGRDEDVLGAGFAQGIFSNRASLTYTEDYESALELYYGAQLTPWMNMSPSIQYIANPGGNKASSDALVVGLRAQMAF
jgi:porin